ncbi:unnamed protein product [Echinostoma caproni]|uniref:DUF5745 domain-containing protein n=1 Tax=Echinostoma caproni TaxID=27848 RepID=A0A183AKE5_9TREM|nr:unnamed protein product [Echinostoma caproni]
MSVDGIPRITSDEVPYLHPQSKLHREENIAAVLSKLSQEIDLQLDHICPADVISGDRRAVSNMLELLTAFILHCVHEDLLDFDRTGFSLQSYHRTSAVNFSGSDAIDSFRHAHLSVSPELPRASLTRRCSYPTTPAQDPVHHKDGFSESRKPLQVLIHDTESVGRNSDTYDQVIPTSKYSPSTMDHPGTSAGMSSSEEQRGRSSLAAPRLTPMQRLHPYFSLPSGGSPPATPKGADEMVEIIRHPSPSTVAPSLRCSVANTSGHSTIDSVDVWDDESSALPRNTANMPPVISLPHQSSEVVIQSPASILSGSDSDPESDSSNLKETAVLRSRLCRKTSSSSSGRGHSPTQTLTAPGASVTSTPPSLSESPPLIPSSSDPFRTEKRSMAPQDAACQTTEDAFSGSPQPCVSQKHSSKHTRDTHTNVRGSQSSMATTNSILAWSADHHSRLKSKLFREHESSTVSVLSSSLISKPSTRGCVGPSPSASVLFARTEGFSRALKRRLDYLRTIFCRAHDEAEAVGQLVQLIGSQQTETLEFMERCLQKGKWSQEQTDTCPTIPSSFKPLEQMIQHILVGIEILLKRQGCSTERKPVHHHNHRSSTRLRFPSRRRSTEKPSTSDARFAASKVSTDKSPQIVRFQELMDMKHNLMMDTLSWLQSELQSRVQPASKSVCNTKSAAKHRLRSPSAIRV